MKKAFLSAAALILGTGSVLAADLPVRMVTKAPVVEPAQRVWDIASVPASPATMSSAASRSRTAALRRRPTSSRATIFLPNWQLYAGIAGYGSDLPTSPSAEIDLYGGVRPTFGPLAFDFGFIYYYYPHEKTLAAGHAGAAQRHGLLRGIREGQLDHQSDLLPRRQRLLFAGCAAYRCGRHLCVDHRQGELPALTTDIGWYLSGELGNYLARQQQFALLRCVDRSARLRHLERGPGLHLQGVHARPALLRHRPVEVGLRVLTGDPGSYPGGTARSPIRVALQSSGADRPSSQDSSADLTLDNLK